MVELGTISHGTLRERDLLPAFADELDRLTRAAIDAGEISSGDAFEHFDTIRDARESVDELDRVGSEDAYQRAGDIVQSLLDALECFAPPFCYFGAHEGDGYDFGFWPILDAIEDSAHEGETIKTDNPPSYIAVVSDHGNVTLYAVELRELWGIV